MSTPMALSAWCSQTPNLPAELETLQDITVDWRQDSEKKTQKKTAKLLVLSTDLISITKSWLASSCRGRLIAWLEEMKPQQGWDIDAAFMMAMGSLDLPRGRERNDRMRHLGIFLDVVRYLKERRNQPIQIYAQEPVLNETDRKLLSLLKIEVLQPPQAENRINRNTFVMAPFYGDEHDWVNQPPELAPILTIGNPFEHVLHRVMQTDLKILANLEGKACKAGHRSTASTTTYRVRLRPRSPRL